MDISWSDIGKLAAEAAFLWSGVWALKKKAEIVGGKVITHSVSLDQVDRVKAELKADIEAAEARLEKKIDDVKSQQITTQVKLYDRLDSIDGAIKSHSINLHKVCQKVGVEWVDDVTVVKGKKA